MRKVTIVLVVVLIALGAMADNSKPLYRQTAKWTIGGEGFWDYLTLSPNGNRLFVAHNDKIDVIDTANGKLVGTIPSEGAHGVAIVPDKNLGFSTNGRAGTVTVFDLQTLKPKTQIKVGENPDAIIYDRYSKHIIVMNGRSHEVSVIDPSTLKVVASVPLGGKLEFAAAAPGRVFVNVENLNEIAVLDSKTWTAVKTWKLEGCEEAGGLAMDHKNGVLFETCGNKVMIVVNAQDGKEIAKLPTGAGTDAAKFDPGLKRAFASNGQGTLTVVQEVGKNKFEVAGNVDTMRGARTMAVDPKTHKIYLATAELGPPAPGERRPTIKPGTFMILVYSPTK